MARAPKAPDTEKDPVGGDPPPPDTKEHSLDDQTVPVSSDSTEAATWGEKD
jgi:hypothetical protein